MSKMSNWVLEMQSQAVHMTLSEFVERFGHYSAPVWYDINFGDDRDQEPELEAMAEGFYGS